MSVDDRLASVLWQWNWEFNHKFPAPPYAGLIEPTKNDLREVARRMRAVLESLPANAQPPTTSLDEADNAGAGTSCKHPGAPFCGHDCDCEDDRDAHMCDYPACDCGGRCKKLDMNRETCDQYGKCTRESCKGPKICGAFAWPQ